MVVTMSEEVASSSGTKWWRFNMMNRCAWRLFEFGGRLVCE